VGNLAVSDHVNPPRMTCSSGQVRRTRNTTDNYVTISIPRSCFPRRWHFTSASWESEYYWFKSSSAYRYGHDITGSRSISITPHA
jgi:hypothetical protein